MMQARDDWERISRNFKRLKAAGVPEDAIDRYLKSEGVSQKLVDHAKGIFYRKPLMSSGQPKAGEIEALKERHGLEC